MKLIKDICAAVPCHSGCDNKESPNCQQSLLEDLYDAKILLKEGQQGHKVSALAQKNMDCDAARATQEAAIALYLHLDKINQPRDILEHSIQRFLQKIKQHC
jgi:hypothetical protein